MKGKTLPQLLLLLGLALASAIMVAAETDQHLSVGGMEVYYGIVPAEVVRELSAQSPAEAGMHGVKAITNDSHHLVVTLYDSKTKARIADATVTAVVSTLGYRHEEKPLSVMTVAGLPSYGNFFRMAGSDKYRIDLKISRKGAPAPIEASFEYRQPQGR